MIPDKKYDKIELDKKLCRQNDKQYKYWIRGTEYKILDRPWRQLW